MVDSRRAPLDRASRSGESADESRDREGRVRSSGSGSKVIVARVADIPPGTRRRVVANGRAIVVFNVEGAFFALKDVCPHQGARLSGGTVSRGLLTADGPGEYHYDRSKCFVICPWHGWEFDLSSGESWFDPTRARTRAYEVSVEPGTACPAAAAADGRAAPDPPAQRSGEWGDQRHRGSFAAEPHDVAVEDEFVVVYA